MPMNGVCVCGHCQDAYDKCTPRKDYTSELIEKAAGEAYVMGWNGCIKLLRELGFEKAADSVMLDEKI